MFEPQANVVFKLTDLLSVNLGAGYRLATGTRDADRSGGERQRGDSRRCRFVGGVLPQRIDHWALPVDVRRA